MSAHRDKNVVYESHDIIQLKYSVPDKALRHNTQGILEIQAQRDFRLGTRLKYVGKFSHQPLTEEERDLRVHCTAGRVGLRATLDAVAESRFLLLPRVDTQSDSPRSRPQLIKLW
jgi:hypothetical protein